MVYYNEFDPKAAQWLRELVKAGHLPEGDVDDRSIHDVQAEDLKGYTQCHFFAGIGGWPLALRIAGWDPGRPVWSGSCPCQPFSTAGKGRGEKDQRHLWPEFRRLIKEGNPSVVFGEQVASKAGREWLGGKPEVQRVRNAQAIVRILPVEDLKRWLQNQMQGVREISGDGGKEACPCCGEVCEVQVIPEEKQGESTMLTGKTPSKKEGHSVFGETRQDTGAHRCRDMRTDRDTVQPGRGQNVGQPITGSDRFLQRIHGGQCEGGALLCQRDGERMGRMQDFGYCRCDTCGTEFPVVRATDAIGGLIEAATIKVRFAGVLADLEALGYGVGAADLCAACLGAPHIRQRLWWVAESGGVRFCEHAKLNSQQKEIPSNRDTCRRHADRCGHESGVADTDSQRESGWGVQRLSEGIESVSGASRQRTQGCGQVHPAWSNAHYIPCADGKARRIECGTSALVARLPKGVVRSCDPGAPVVTASAEARVMRLKGYGNSIVPQVAAEFIGAYLDGVSNE